MKKTYIIYALFRPCGQVCYIGKGKSEYRIRQHFKTARRPKGRMNPYLKNIIRKHNFDIPWVVIRSGLSEPEAFEVEIALIKAIGRKAHGGPLVNCTDGGEGPSGLKFKPEVLKKLSDVSKARWADKEFKKQQSEIRKKRSPISRAKTGAAARAMWADEEFKGRMSEIHSARWTEEECQAHSKRLKEAFATEEHKKKQSKAAKRFWAEVPGDKMKVYSENRSRFSKMQWEGISEERYQEKCKKTSEGVKRWWAKRKQLQLNEKPRERRNNGHTLSRQSDETQPNHRLSPAGEHFCRSQTAGSRPAD